jgi:hypothetical protein
LWRAAGEFPNPDREEKKRNKQDKEEKQTQLPQSSLALEVALDSAGNTIGCSKSKKKRARKTDK